jgi:hypothetical protein
MKSLSFRIGADVLILFLIFLLPWWAAAIFILAGLFFLDNYFEIIFFGFLLDSLYSSSSGLWRYVFTTTTFILFCIEIFVKQRVRL